MKRQTVVFGGVVRLIVAGTACAQYSITDLGTLPDGSFSYASGINVTGQVAGYALASGGDYHAYPIVVARWLTWVRFRALVGLYVATGINAGGQVAGYAYTSSGSGHAFLYSNGVMADLGTLGGLDSRQPASMRAGR